MRYYIIHNSQFGRQWYISHERYRAVVAAEKKRRSKLGGKKSYPGGANPFECDTIIAEVELPEGSLRRFRVKRTDTPLYQWR